MLEKVWNGIFGPWEMTEEFKIIYLYRYISLILTSSFYVSIHKNSSEVKKIIIILCLTISSILLNRIYLKSKTIKKYIKYLIAIEILGNTFMLIPTGGISSPYIWYSLNTVLISAYFLNIYYCIANLIFYLLFASGISYAFFMSSKMNFLKFIHNNSNLILSFILITSIVQLLVALTKKLDERGKKLEELNIQLTEANKRQKESMELSVSLYQAVHSFVNLNNKDKLIQMLVEYTKNITKTPLVFLYLPLKDGQFEIKSSRYLNDEFNYYLNTKIKNKWEELLSSSDPINIYVKNRNFIVINVRSSHSIYGILGVQINWEESELFVNQSIDQLKFLASLSSIVLERFELEEIRSDFLINAEQNRIANEIHDSVSQRLFAISCGVHILWKKLDGNLTADIHEEFNSIRDSLRKSIKELRETIYGMSWKKFGESAFKKDIKKYIDDICKLYNIDISLDIKGDEEATSLNIKKALYRIICEGTGNAIRHGKSSQVNIIINIQKDYVELDINDNGSGFDLEEKLLNEQLGLGIKNINNLVNSLSGKVKIKSDLGKGTHINVLLPNSILINSKQEEAV